LIRQKDFGEKGRGALRRCGTPVSQLPGKGDEKRGHWTIEPFSVTKVEGWGREKGFGLQKRNKGKPVRSSNGIPRKVGKKKRSLSRLARPWED